MILDLDIPRKNGKILAQESEYKPSIKERERRLEILQAFELGKQTMDKPYREFDDLSLLERQARDQQSFNIYVSPKSNDPDEEWKSDAVRPIVRNRIISIAAHVTGALIYPQIFAQNDQDEEDKDAAMVMRDLMEYSSDQADYSKTFLYAVISALVNPAVIIHTEFAKVMRKVKDMKEDGSFTEKEILDELYSGFKDYIVPIEELFISNIYEPDLQKQSFLVRRKAIDYSIAQAKYGNLKKYPNFKYVKPGHQMLFDGTTEVFYEIEDENLQHRLVEEVVYYNRAKDLEVILLNGVLVTTPDRGNPRKDKMYPFAKSGYEIFHDGQFFYYSSLAKKMSKDAEIVNTLYRMVIDGTFLQLMPPTAVFGNEQVNSSIVTPGTVTTFSQDTKLQKIDVGNNLAAGYNALDKVESSISESSNDILQSGQSVQGSQTAFEISRLEQNARVMLGLFAKMIGFLVKDLGELRLSDIVQFMTVGDVNELTGDGNRMRFQKILLPEKTVEGRQVTRKIEFGTEVDDRPEMERSFDVLEEEGGMDSDKQIIKVNAKAFRDMKFTVKVSPSLVTPPSDNLKKALNLEAFDRLIQLPFVDHEAITRDLLLGSYDATKFEAEKYLKSEEDMAQQAQAQQGQTPGATPKAQPSVLNKLFGQGQEKNINTAV